MKTSLKLIPLIIYITKDAKLKDLLQWVANDKDRHQRCTTQLDEFQEIGVQLLVKDVSVLQEVHAGRKDVIAKIIENSLDHEETKSREIAEKIKERVKEITQ